MIETKTRTFAEIYESQGHYKDALNIYIDLLKEDPLDAGLTDNIKRLQGVIYKQEEEGKTKLEEKVAALNNLLQKFYAYRSA